MSTLRYAPSNQDSLQNSLQILLLHGPNLNLLGQRTPEHYGQMTLAMLEDLMKETLDECRMARPLFPEETSEQVSLFTFQTQYEGRMLELLHNYVISPPLGILINPGAWSHTSLALFDALECVRAPVVELHLSDPVKRGGLRTNLVLDDLPQRIGNFYGEKEKSYIKGMRFLWDHLSEKKD